MVVHAKVDLALPRLALRGDDQMPPAWRPRQSPPAASAASSADRSRSASGSSEPSNASAIDSQTRSLSTMFAWALKPSPAVKPAAGMQLSPTCTATRPSRVEDRDLTVRGVVVGGDELGERLLGLLPAAQQLEAEGAVRDLGVRLRRNDAHAGRAPRDDRAGVEGPRLHGDAELAGLRVAADDRVGHPRIAEAAASTFARQIFSGTGGRMSSQIAAKLSLSCRIRAGRPMNHQCRCSLPSPQRAMCTRPMSPAARTARSIRCSSGPSSVASSAGSVSMS